jgi:photosystem II stability/assembly factor-like uncharacterized protein
VNSAPYTWRNVEIAGGGFVSGIITHPAKQGLMYARTDIGGAYRWDAVAKRWVALTDWVTQDDWNLTGIESIALDHNNPDRVYMAAGTYTNDWAGNGAILRSDDQGKTWQRTNMPFKMGGNEDGRSNGERLAVDPNAPSNLFFGSRRNGLWKSTDRGATWSQVSSFPAVATTSTNNIGIVFVQFIASSGVRGRPTPEIYAAISSKEGGLFRSSDGGATWAAVAGQPRGILLNHAVLDRDGTMYFSGGDTPGPNGMTRGAIWKLSTKTGAWTEISPIRPSEGENFGYGGVTLDAQRPGTLMVSTMDRWARGDDLFRSTDGGKSWVGIKEKAQHDISGAPWLSWGRDRVELGHWIGDIEIDPFNSDHVLFVTGTGIRASENVTQADRGLPTKWIVRAQGIEECVVNEIVSPPSGAPLLSVVWDIDGFRHEDLNTSPINGFFKPSFGHNRGLDFAERDPNFVVRVFGGNNSNGALSTDNGVTWTPFASKPTGTKGEGTICVAPDASTLVWTPLDAGAFFSRDRGVTWQPSVGLPEKLRVTADRVSAKLFYAFDSASGTLWASVDGGASFAAAASTLPKARGWVRAVPGFQGHLWLATDQGLFRSRDSGVSFSKVAGVDNATKIGFGKAAPGRNYPSLYLVGRPGGTYGIHRSADEGATWVRVNDDEHQFGFINSITGDPRVFGRVYIGSANRGIQYAEPKANGGL